MSEQRARRRTADRYADFEELKAAQLSGDEIHAAAAEAAAADAAKSQQEVA